MTKRAEGVGAEGVGTENTETESTGTGGGAKEGTAGDREAGGPEEAGFEARIEELESIVARLDREELDLDRALELFERGVAQLRGASRLLEEAKGRVEELIQDAAGDLRTVDFELPGEEEDGDAGDD